MGSFLKPRKTEITEKLRFEINKVVNRRGSLGQRVGEFGAICWRRLGHLDTVSQWSMDVEACSEVSAKITHADLNYGCALPSSRQDRGAT